MVPALQFTYWQWLSLTLAAPVVVWGGLAVPPGRLDQPAPRRGHHGHAGLDRARSPPSAGRCTRCSSAPPAMPGMTHPFELTVARGDGAGNIYLEVAAGRHHVPAGRPVRSRPGPSGGPAPRCARCWSSAPRTSSVLRDGAEVRVPVDAAARSATGSSSGPARRSPPTAWSSRARPPSTPRCSPASRCRSRSAPATRSSARRQRRRPAGRPRHPGRRGHPAGPDGRGWSSRRRAARRGAAAGRPGLRRVRAGRASCSPSARSAFWLLAGGRRRRPRSPPRSPC